MNKRNNKKIHSRKNSKLHKAHDRYFRQNLADLNVAKDFITTHLPAEILTKIDLNSLESYPESFIEDNLKEKITDLIYKVKIQNSYGYISILIERQSTDDDLMAFRLLKYRVLLMEKHIKQTPEYDDLNPLRLPIIVSLLFYHGEKTPYPHSTDFFTFFEDQELAKKIFCQPFHLVDITVIPDEKIKQHTLIGLLELSQKHIRDRDFLKNINNLTEIINNMLDLSLKNPHRVIEYIENTIFYIVNLANIDDIEEFNKALENISIMKETKYMATIAQQLEKRGEIRGMEKMATIAQQLEKRGEIRGMEKMATIAQQLEKRGEIRGEARGEARGVIYGELRCINTIAKQLSNKGLNQKDIAQIISLTKKELELL